jgi:hypothetical protein
LHLMRSGLTIRFIAQLNREQIAHSRNSHLSSSDGVGNVIVCSVQSKNNAAQIFTGERHEARAVGQSRRRIGSAGNCIYNIRRRCRIIRRAVLRRAADSNWWPYACQSFPVGKTLIGSSDISEVGWERKELEAGKRQWISLHVGAQRQREHNEGCITYETPTGAGSRGAYLKPPVPA